MVKKKSLKIKCAKCYDQLSLKKIKKNEEKIITRAIKINVLHPKHETDMLSLSHCIAVSLLCVTCMRCLLHDHSKQDES